MASADTKAVVSVLTSSDAIPNDKAVLSGVVTNMANGTSHFASIWKNIRIKNQSLAGKIIKKSVGPLVVGGKGAAEMESATTVGWMLKGFGPLPAECTRSRQ